MKLRSLFFTAILVVALASTAGAKGLLDKNLHYFQPTVDGSGLIVSYGSEPLGMYRMYYGVFGDAAMNILDYKRPPQFEKFNENNPPTDEDMEDATLIKNQIGVNPVWGIGFWEVINVGLAIPFVASRTFDDEFEGGLYPAREQNTHRKGIEGEDYSEDTDKFAMDDVRLDVKVIGFNRLQRCLGLGLVTTFAFPVAYQPSQFTSDGGLTIAPRIIFDIGRERWTAVLNAGYKWYGEKSYAELPGLVDRVGKQTPGKDFKTGDELMANLGAKFRFSYGSEFIIDSALRTFANDPFGDDREDYAEVMVAYRKYFRGLNFTALTFGAGVGLTDGVGTPMGRLFMGISRDEKRFYIMSY